MRVMVIVKGNKDSEAGVMPSKTLLTEMGNYNDELVAAGLMLAGEGLHPSSKGVRVRFSGDKRTVIDGLKQPEHCGGFTEVAKGFWMRRDAIAVTKLVDYALRLGVGAVVRRLGFLLETFEVEAAPEFERLRAALTATYAPLDPLMPAEGPWHARWRVRVNVEPDELRALLRT